MPTRRQPPGGGVAKASSPRPRQVKPAPKRGRTPSDVPAAEHRVLGPSELATEIGYARDSIYKWEQQGLERAPGGKGFTLPTVLRFLEARARAEGRMEADPDDVLEAEKLRDLRARADMREDERDLQRRKLIEVELAVAVYQDDATHVAVHLRGLGARLMLQLAAVDDPEAICAMIDTQVEEALRHLNADHVDPACPDCHPYLGGAEIEGRA